MKTNGKPDGEDDHQAQRAGQMQDLGGHHGALVQEAQQLMADDDAEAA